MKTRYKVLLSMVIVIAILVGYAGYVQSHVENFQVIKAVCLKESKSKRPEPKPKQLSWYESYIVPEPIEDTEVRTGADLYRFYIAQINEQYYPVVDPYVALAVLELESSYQPNVVSKAGAVGLMQWIPKYHLYRAYKYGLNDPFDPYTNIIVGMDILNEYYLSTGSWQTVLYGYNHSTAYVNMVLARTELLKGEGYFD